MIRFFEHGRRGFDGFSRIIFTMIEQNEVTETNFTGRKVFASYNFPASAPLPDLLYQLLEHQKNFWPMAAEGYRSLQYAQVREVKCRTFSVWLQYNPKRLVSTGAKVDAPSISQRRCFLCVDHLPAGQQGVLYEKEFLILCNPMPIFPAHYTIAHVAHQPQRLAPYLGALLKLSRDLSPHFTVFYNGAQCGASAPDHFHFQAAPAGKIPIEHEAVQASRREVIAALNDVSITLLKDLGRTAIVFESAHFEKIANILQQQLEKMQAGFDISEEPKVNLLCSYEPPQWRVILFPRRKHRPDVFFKEGDEKILISPASVDMGGLIVTPIEKDFKTVDAKMIEAIYQEVSWDEKMVRRMLT